MNTSCNSALTNTASLNQHEVQTERSYTVITVTARVTEQKMMTTVVTANGPIHD